MSAEPAETENRSVVVQMHKPPVERTPVESYVPIFDTYKFEHYGRVATVMAETGMLPETLIKDGKDYIPDRMQKARAFMIVELADRWNASPFALMQACSYVHGKLMLEGKVVHAAIESNVGVVLKYDFGKWNAQKEAVDLSVEGEGDSLGVRVSAVLPGETEPRFIDGGVGSWKTNGNGSPWKAGAYRRQLRYRGAREWCRAFKPSLLIGILTDDELDGMVERQAANSRTRTEKVNLREKLAAPKPGDEGFSAEHVEGETRGRVIDAEATVVVEAELQVGGEKAVDAEAGGAVEAEETDAGNASAAQSAEQASAGSDSATDASPASPAQTAPSQTESSSSADAGPKAEPAKAAPKPAAAAKPKAASSKPAPAEDDPIGDFIDSLEPMTKWAEQIKAAWFTFKKGDAYKAATVERQREAQVAIVERVFELNDAGELDLQPHQDPTFFSAWCGYMLEKGPRPTGAQHIAKELDLLRQNDAFKALSAAAQQGLEQYANSIIGITGEGILA